MTLSTFLRGARSNPQPPAAWRLLHRHAEGGPWTVVVEVGGPEGLADEFASGWRHWPVDAAPGDLASVSPPPGEQFGDLPRHLGLGLGGELFPLPPVVWSWNFDPDARRWAQGRSWEECWSTCVRPAWMLTALQRLDTRHDPPRLPRPRFVRLACELADELLDLLPRGERDEVARALALLRRWCEVPGDADLAGSYAQEDLQRCAATLQDEAASCERTSRGDDDDAAASTLFAAAAAVHTALLSTLPGDALASMVGHVEDALHEAGRTVHASTPVLADRVRAAFPLRDLVLVMAP